MKENGLISFASIAPFDDDQVQSHYLAFTNVSQFMAYFQTQSSNYNGGKVLVSFISDGSGGLSPENGFFSACSRLKNQQELHGIFVWCADESKAKGLGFSYEKQSQALLAN
ncbi:hypothetical protein CsSME_00028480 [Camellia sinensis var. sinensis]